MPIYGYINTVIANVTISNTGVVPTGQITVTNQLRDYNINSIEDLPDVTENDVTSGSTIVYNSNNDHYEIKKLGINDVEGDIVIDGGEF